MNQRWLGLIIILAICALLPKLTFIGSHESETPSPSARFELTYFDQGGSMTRPQHTPPMLSVRIRAKWKPRKASVERTSTEGASHFDELSIREAEGDWSYAHFWGQQIEGQPSHKRDPSQWSRHGLRAYLHPEEVCGTYELVSGGTTSIIKIHPAEARALSPTTIAPVVANPIDGFKVSWTPVDGAIGYQVQARSNTGDTIIWKNSNEDWLTFGSKDSLACGILLEDTNCNIPSGIFHGPVYVDVKAVSQEVRGDGEIPIVFWAESNMSMKVDSAKG